jgi:hypothetical protein
VIFYSYVKLPEGKATNPGSPRCRTSWIERNILATHVIKKQRRLDDVPNWKVIFAPQKKEVTAEQGKSHRIAVPVPGPEKVCDSNFWSFQVFQVPMEMLFTMISPILVMFVPPKLSLELALEIFQAFQAYSILFKLAILAMFLLKAFA